MNSMLFGGAGDDTLVAGIVTTDERYAMVGNSTSSNSGDIADTNNGNLDGLLVTRTFAPIITAPGDESIYQGNTFNEWAGVSATDYEDGDLTSSIEVLGVPTDTNIPGEYTITYKVTDSDSNLTTFTKVLTVAPDLAPVLTIPGTVKINPGDTFDE